MSGNGIHFEKLTVQKAPGFETGGFEVEDFCPGVNIIHGPNGSGKTTMATTLQSLLWPDTANGETSAIGHLRLNGDDWRINLDHTHTSYQKNGVEDAGPNLPNKQHRPRYHLSLHDLLQHETTNESFAAEIEREMVGGYDLSAASKELGVDDSVSSKNIGEYQETKSAVEQWRNRINELQKLEDRQDQLPTLRSDLEEAEDAEQRVELLDQAIKYAKAQNTLTAAESKLEGFPDVISDVDGTEADRVEDLNDRINEHQEAITGAKERRTDARERISEANLPDEGLPDGLVDELKARRDSLKSTEEALESHDEELAAAKKRRAAARTEIPIEADDSELEAITPATWEDIAAFFQQSIQVRKQQEVKRAVDDWLQEDETLSAGETTLNRGRSALEEWLQVSRPPTPEDENVDFMVAVASAATVAAAGIALGLFVHPGLFAVLLVALGLLWYVYQDRVNSDERAQYRETFERLDLRPPAEWSQDAVRTRLTALYDELAKARLDQERQNKRETISSTIAELEASEAELKSQREELVERYGLEIEMSDLELVAITNGIIRWQNAHEDVLKQHSKIEAAAWRRKSHREDLETTLEQYGYSEVPDASVATRFIRDLENRQDIFSDARRDVEQANRTIADAEDKVAGLREQRSTIYSDLGLADGDLEHLKELCEQVDEYDPTVSRVNRKEEVRDAELRELESHSDYKPELTDLSVEELREQKQGAEDTAGRLDELKKKITQIEADINRAKESAKVETAAAKKTRALKALEKKRQENAAAMVGDALFEHIRDVRQAASRPDVLMHASELFTQITRGRYELLVEDGDFRAFDTVQERGYALDELSSGTRVQLLLAVRIGFVEHHEQGSKLPIFLDETLANTDDTRAAVLIESLLELARKGRQVWYFTAQGDEVAKWQAQLEAADDATYATIDLAAARELEKTIEVPDFEPLSAAPPTLPDPDKHDHAEYGEALDVPPFNPRAGAGSVHLWYLIEDVDLLHHLLHLGIEQWGQLRALLENTEGSPLDTDSDQLARIDLHGQALEEYVKSWKYGRGERVDRSVLEETSAVTDAFIDEVSELAEDVNGDAELIIEELQKGEVKGFRSNKTDELKAYFQEEGFIQQRNTLNADTILVRVVEKLLDAGLSDQEAHTRAYDLFTRLEARSQRAVV